MIREEFKKEQDFKRIGKEPYINVINKDRSFYVSKMNKLSKSLKSYNFMAKFFIILGVLLLVPIILSVIFKIEISVKLIFILVLEGFSIFYALLWYLIMKPNIKKRYDYCRKKVSEINATQINKQKINLINK